MQSAGPAGEQEPTLTEAQDMQGMVRAIDDALNLLNGHLQLSAADASATISSVHEVLSSPDLSESLERVRLRVLNMALTERCS